MLKVVEVSKWTSQISIIVSQVPAVFPHLVTAVWLVETMQNQVPGRGRFEH